jgi:hypothetical protein
MMRETGGLVVIARCVALTAGSATCCVIPRDAGDGGYRFRVGAASRRTARACLPRCLNCCRQGSLTCCRLRRSGAAGGPCCALLSPLAAVTAAVTARRVARPAERAGAGDLLRNVTVGGAGKTALALDLGRRRC